MVDMEFSVVIVVRRSTLASGLDPQPRQSPGHRVSELGHYPAPDAPRVITNRPTHLHTNPPLHRLHIHFPRSGV